MRPATILRLTAPLLAVVLIIGIGNYSRRKAYERPAYEQQARVWINLGMAHKDRGDMQLARQCWETALTYPEGQGYCHLLAHKNLRRLSMLEGQEIEMAYHNAEIERLQKERRWREGLE